MKEQPMSCASVCCTYANNKCSNDVKYDSISLFPLICSHCQNVVKLAQTGIWIALPFDLKQWLIDRINKIVQNDELKSLSIKYQK